MNIDVAARLAHRLVAATGGWTEEGTMELSEEISTWGNEQAAIEAIESVRRSWIGDFRPPLAWVIKAYNDAVDLQRQRHPALPSGSPGGCGGSRWVNGVPCPRCNPYLHDIYGEPARWDRYLGGTPLHLLHSAVKWDASKGRAYVEGGMPPACLVDTIHDPADAPVDFVTGVAAARRGYAAQCLEEDREPDWDYFDKMFAAALSSALNRPEQT